MTEKIEEVKLEDGSSTKFTIYQKDAAKGQPVVILFPAMGTPASYYQPLAQALAEKEITSVTVDLRGIGHSSIRPGRGSNFGYHEMIELDYKGVLQKIQELFPSERKFLIGHSLGGQLGGLFMSKYPGIIDGLILIGSCSVYYQGWQGWRKWQTLFATQFFGLVASVLGYFPGDKLGFGGVGATGVMQDWSRNARTGKYRVANSNFDFETYLGKIDKPVMAISFKADTFSPYRAVENLLAKFKAAPKIHRQLDRIPSSGKKYSHYSWVKNPEEVVGVINNWLKSE